MIRAFAVLLILSCSGAWAQAPGAAGVPSPAVMASPQRPTQSGIETQYFDPSRRAQDDFYEHVNGKWLTVTEIPADKAVYGPADVLVDQTQEQLRALIESTTRDTGQTAAADEQKIADLYASFMDEERLAALALAPLQPLLGRIDGIGSKRELAALMVDLERIGVTVPFELSIDQDSRDSTQYAAGFNQSGLGMPDRDYYLLARDKKLSGTRAAYEQHIRRTLMLANDPAPVANARDIVRLETALARVQWTKVANRDPVKTYNKMSLAKLAGLTPAFAWRAYLHASGLDDRVRTVIVSQPSYMHGFSNVLDSTSLPVWKAYFRWQVLRAYAPYLDSRFVDEAFAFEGKVLRGIPENRPRWKRAVKVVEQSMGFALGKLYVERHFPPESKARMEKLVANLLEAYRQSIDILDWMGPETRREARAKLAKLTTKIGYPNRWRDYGTLEIRRDDLVGNVMRAVDFEYVRNRDKLGKPIDRDEWFMTPQTVNAYYNPSMNEIVFPAAYLQPPYFNPEADDAANYGGVGSTIGHEISHGFDDTGSQFDGDGNLRNWWTKADHQRFDEKTKVLVTQYNAFSPLAGYTVNGALTLGENIADNSGLEIAYKAYRLSLNGQQAPVIDGMTGDQRFMLSYAQGWREKIRPEQALVYLKSDTHAPDKFRCNGSLANLDAFYDAFEVRPGDRMYLAPEERVRIW
ncbi:MAG: M13 family metallopeptidase [Pseudomonadota bacterium]|nr:M13 family metallopeptidase [Pseudomonadota bacterium]